MCQCKYTFYHTIPDKNIIQFIALYTHKIYYIHLWINPPQKLKIKKGCPFWDSLFLFFRHFKTQVISTAGRNLWNFFKVGANNNDVRFLSRSSFEMMVELLLIIYNPSSFQPPSLRHFNPSRHFERSQKSHHSAPSISPSLHQTLPFISNAVRNLITTSRYSTSLIKPFPSFLPQDEIPHNLPSF